MSYLLTLILGAFVLLGVIAVLFGASAAAGTAFSFIWRVQP